MNCVRSVSFASAPAGAAEFAEFDGDEVIADAFYLTEQVRGDDDRDAELASGTFD